MSSQRYEMERLSVLSNRLYSSASLATQVIFVVVGFSVGRQWLERQGGPPYLGEVLGILVSYGLATMLIVRIAGGRWVEAVGVACFGPLYLWWCRRRAERNR